MLPARTLLAGSSSRATVSRKEGPPAATPNATGRKANRPSIAICRSYGRATVLSMRLHAYLARAGVASRRGADALIKAGRVTVNGRRGELNTFAGAADDVRVDGRPVGAQRLRHVLLNKPRGTITTARDPESRPTVVDLVGGEIRVVPVGRLDRDTTGVLLLTNDGALAHRLAHPRYGVEKTYVADVEGEPTDDVIRRLAEGVELDDGPTAPARVRRLAPSR